MSTTMTMALVLTSSASATLSASSATRTSSASLPLVTFDGAAGTTFKFKELNDPVMGGRSTGTWRVDTAGQFGVFDGEVVNVPSLSAPGFIKAAADGVFNDVSATIAGSVSLKVRTSTPDYKGYRVTVVAGAASPDYSCSGGGSIPFSRGCYKAKFSVPASTNFTEISIPWDQFSDMWSPATGEQTTTCADDPSVCLTAKTLANIQRIEVWGEGAAGKLHLEVSSISASTASLASDIRPPKEFDTCNAAVQSNLRYGISGRDTPTVPIAVNETETLAEAVCCDKRVAAYAEPQFLFAAPDISLFTKLDATGVTTYYDSVCGKPLFKAPVGRTFQEYQDDTNEHGWPSFRSAEIVSENVITDKVTGYVTSVCGTHLGSYLPDEAGPRWCMDLSCISGNPM